MRKNIERDIETIWSSYPDSDFYKRILRLHKSRLGEHNSCNNSRTILSRIDVLDSLNVLRASLDNSIVKDVFAVVVREDKTPLFINLKSLSSLCDTCLHLPLCELFTDQDDLICRRELQHGTQFIYFRVWSRHMSKDMRDFTASKFESKPFNRKDLDLYSDSVKPYLQDLAVKYE